MRYEPSNFTPIHLQPFHREMFGYKEGDFPVIEFAGRTSIAIPFHNYLTAEEIDYVAEVLERAPGSVRCSRKRQGWQEGSDGKRNHKNRARDLT